MLLNLKNVMFLGFLIVSQGVSANVWLPVGPNVASITFGASSMQNARIGIFNSGGYIANSKPIVSFTGNAKVSFVQDGMNWDITVKQQSSSGGTLITRSTLFGSNLFQLGWFSNGVWIPEAFSSLTDSNDWLLTFKDLTHGGVTESITVSNISQSLTNDVADDRVNIMPLSLAAWMFLCGFMVCLAFGKHRQLLIEP